MLRYYIIILHHGKSTNDSDSDSHFDGDGNGGDGSDMTCSNSVSSDSDCCDSEFFVSLLASSAQLSSAAN